MATQYLLKDNITATKYYEQNISPVNYNTGNNETDICLSLINSVKPTVNTTTFLGGEELTTPGKYFKFTEYLTCIRTTNNSSNANRSYKIHINKNFISIFSGKIDHVNLASEEVIDFLKKS